MVKGSNFRKKNEKKKNQVIDLNVLLPEHFCVMCVVRLLDVVVFN